MSPLISQLRTEHGLLAVGLIEIRSSIDPVTGKLPVDKTTKALTMAERLLLAHLGKEDAKLYPVLQAHAAKDPTTATLIRIFGDEMAGISSFALGFFAKYKNKGNLDTPEFAKDLGTLLDAASARIAKEELELYPAYEKALTELSPEAVEQAVRKQESAPSAAAAPVSPAEASHHSENLWGNLIVLGLWAVGGTALAGILWKFFFAI